MTNKNRLRIAFAMLVENASEELLDSVMTLLKGSDDLCQTINTGILPEPTANIRSTRRPASRASKDAPQKAFMFAEGDKQFEARLESLIKKYPKHTELVGRAQPAKVREAAKNLSGAEWLSLLREYDPYCAYWHEKVRGGEAKYVPALYNWISKRGWCEELPEDFMRRYHDQGTGSDMPPERTGTPNEAGLPRQVGKESRPDYSHVESKESHEDTSFDID